MPRMMVDDDSMQTGSIGTTQSFQFSATRVDHLSSSEYTLVGIAVDLSGSVNLFADGLRRSLIAIVESCRKSPRANNLLVRVITFNSRGVVEIHGFKPLSDIDTAQYPVFSPSGGTPLFDAAFSTFGGINAYAKMLMDQDFLANGIGFVITDGDDNDSTATIQMIKDEMVRAANTEEIESLLGILIGINAKSCTSYLNKFAQGADLKYLDAGDATPGKLAKLAEFVSQSVSSQSQSLGSGGPSQNIAATI